MNHPSLRPRRGPGLSLLGECSEEISVPGIGPTVFSGHTGRLRSGLITRLHGPDGQEGGTQGRSPCEKALQGSGYAAAMGSRGIEHRGVPCIGRKSDSPRQPFQLSPAPESGLAPWWTSPPAPKPAASSTACGPSPAPASTTRRFATGFSMPQSTCRSSSQTCRPSGVSNQPGPSHQDAVGLLLKIEEEVAHPDLQVPAGPRDALGCDESHPEELPRDGILQVARGRASAGDDQVDSPDRGSVGSGQRRTAASWGEDSGIGRRVTEREPTSTDPRPGTLDLASVAGELEKPLTSP